MKIEQKPKFQPITIMLETREEALLFWEYTSLNETKDIEKLGKLEELSKAFNSWFSNIADI